MESCKCLLIVNTAGLCKALGYQSTLYLSIEPSGLYLTVNTHVHPIVVFPLGKLIKSQVPFISRALISSMIASLYLRTTRASYVDFGIATEDMLVVKALKELDNLWYDTYLKIGCMVQDLVPFLRATGISRSLEVLESEIEEKIGKIVPSWVPMTSFDSWIVAKV